MKHFHKNRLLKLATFLDTLPRAQFDFATVFEKRECGTVGCAMGWTPAVFPRLVKYKDWGYGNSDVRTKRRLGFGAVAQEIFGLTTPEAMGLFVSEYNMVVGEKMVNDKLGDNAWPTSVARRIRRFITRKALV